MLVISHKSGQLGNRLFAFAHIIAAAEAGGFSVVNLSFDEYARYFQGTSQDVLCRYPSTDSYIKSNRIRSWLFVLNKAVLKFLRIGRLYSSPFHRILVADLPEYEFKDSRYYDLRSAPFLEMARKKQIVFLFGRFFRDYGNLESYQKIIKRYLAPTTQIETRIDIFFENAKNGADLMIGVHMRRGDYEQFAEGKYFYSQAEYGVKMKELQLGLTGKKVKFIVCSNEEIDLRNFEMSNVIKGPGHLVEDMYVLAKCDYIMGPPSTFTLWASFYGSKPLFQIKNLKDPIALDHFAHLPAEILFNFSFN